jgi:hypothetical protein
MVGLKRSWNRFLNWLYPSRRARLLSEIMKRDQELGLYDEVTFPLKKEVFNKISQPNFTQTRVSSKEEMD